ncbi:MAG: leucine-rich repeat protein, partial [Clostridia bacterium]|nr:leucine-rich repeat protein [Clostridia bacterium]
ETIDDNAYKNTNITELTIPESVTSIEDGAFENCTQLKKVYFNATNCSCSFLTSIFYGSGLEEIEFGENVTAIPGYVCWGCEDLKTVKLGDKVEIIGAYAFRGCSSLKSLLLPATVKDLGNYALTDCGVDVINIKSEDSDAAVALIDYEYKFEADEVGIKDKEDRLLKRDAVKYELSESFYNNENRVYLSLRYEFKDQAAENVSNLSLKIKIPSSSLLESNNVRINGKKDGKIKFYNGLITISNIPAKGNVTFSIVLADAGYFASYAAVEYKYGGQSRSEVIGIINSLDELVTVSAPSETNDSEITVKGLATANKIVSIYVNGELVREVQSSAGGNYCTKIQLPTTTSEETFEISASISEGKRWARTKVIYSSDAVTVTSATMIFSNREFDLLSNKINTLSYSILKKNSYAFFIKVDNVEAVKAMYVVANGSQLLRCSYFSKMDAFIGIGFDNVMVSNISLRCITDPNVDEVIKKLLTTPNLLSESEISSCSTELCSTLTSVVVKNTMMEDQENGEFIYEMKNAATNETSTIRMVKLPFREFTEEDVIKTGYTYRPSENSEDSTRRYVYVNSYGDVDEATYVRFDENGEPLSAYTATFSGLYMIGAFILNESSDDISLPDDLTADGIDQFIREKIFESFLYGMETYADDAFYSAFQGLVDSSILGEAAAGTAGLFMDFAKRMFDVIVLGKELSEAQIAQAALCLAGLVLTCLAPEFAVPIALIVKFTNFIIDLIESGFFESFFNVIMDPSGVVYEGVKSNAVEGATVTALWIPYDEDNADFWNEDFPDLSKAVVWEAEEYEQENPLTTGSDGAYAWDVPIGWWIVKTEKDGYGVSYSAWMEVPPERTDINISMISEAAPAVKFVNLYEDEAVITFSQYMNVNSVKSSDIKFVCGDKDVAGTIAAVNPEAGDDGANCASIFSFKPVKPFSGEVLLTVSGCVNYCGTAMTEEYKQTFVVEERIESLLVPDEISADCLSKIVIGIFAAPASAAEGKKILVSLDGDISAKTDMTELTFDNNGMAFLVVDTLMPGEVSITYSIDGTNVTAKTVLLVGAGSELDEAECTFTDNRDGTHTMFSEKDGHGIVCEHELENGVCICGFGGYIKGDINNDKSADNKDVVTLFRYLTGFAVTVVMDACDVDGDGNIDNRDVVHLFRFVSTLHKD